MRATSEAMLCYIISSREDVASKCESRDPRTNVNTTAEWFGLVWGSSLSGTSKDSVKEYLMFASNALLMRTS